MIKKLSIVCLLAVCYESQAQFKRSSDSNAYPYTATLGGNYVFIIGRPGVTNYNYAYSNLSTTISNIAAGEAYYATNGSLSTMTNIAAYQAYLATNGWTAIASNISAYQAFLATNNFLSTSTNIANYLINQSNSTFIGTNFLGPTNSAVVGQVLHATSTAGASKWDYVNQARTNISTGSNANFSLPFSRFTIGTAFTWTAPANIDSTATKIQVTDIAVTNSTAAAVLASFASTVTVTGTPYITNETLFHWRVTPWWTNCLCEPLR